MRWVTRPNNRKERLRRKVQFLLTVIKITVTIDHEIPVSDFISNKFEVFSSPSKIFVLKSFDNETIFLL